LLNREVTIDSLIQSPDIQNTEISFKRMAAAGRRNRSQHMTGIHVLPYALGSPQKEREFFNGHRLCTIGSAAFPVSDRGFEINLAYLRELVIGGKINASGCFRVRLFNRWRRNSSVLIRFRKIDVLADAVF